MYLCTKFCCCIFFFPKKPQTWSLIYPKVYKTFPAAQFLVQYFFQHLRFTCHVSSGATASSYTKEQKAPAM